MKLQEKYYTYIKEGTKRIELRLFDEKRSSIALGDKISFLNVVTSETIVTNVVGLLRYITFRELFRDFDIDILADKSMEKDEFLDVMNKLYADQDQEENGVLGIRIELESEQ